jgi:hypothetical protein
LNDQGAFTYNAVYADLAYAASEWARYLNSDATIRVQVDVGDFPGNLGLIVQNDADDFVQVGTNASGTAIVEPWGEYALLTDSHVPRSPYDIHIYFNPNEAVDGYPVYINPDPAAGGPVPTGDYDTTTMFLKALGYGLGLATMTTTTALQATDSVTGLDNYVQSTPHSITGISLGADDIGAYHLGGPVVDAVNGGPVSLVTPEQNYLEAFEHIGNTPTIAGSSDIFAVSQDITGESLQISRLDLAMMQEAGVPIIAGALPCFAAGTRIATPRGAVAIERLQIGDTVLTISGAPQQITWIGRRHIDCRRHPDPDQVLPVRIAPHAFGHGRPRHAVLLSPDHAVFVEDVLIPIRFLVNRSTIARLAVETITYYHIELAQHDVVLAEGLPVETYLETGGRNAFESADGVIQLHPNFAPDEARRALAWQTVRIATVWQGCGYAPLLGDGSQLRRARAKLQLQAALLGECRRSRRRHTAAAA